ncbi:MAG: formylglycine-generating enzyme family protein [Bacteroidia bacterium]
MTRYRPVKVLLMAAMLVSILSFSSSKRLGYMPQPRWYVYVPTGTMFNEDGKNVSINAFWMSWTEITNAQYKEYLADVDSTMPHTKPDTSMLNSQLWINKYKDYFTYSMFDDFPVVGLSKEQMENYALWRGEQYRKENPEWEGKFRLPTKEEWQYAASGGRQSQEFPWGESFYRNSKGCNLMHFFDLDQRFAVYGDEGASKVLYRNDISDSLASAEYSKMTVATKSFKKLKRRHFGKGLPYLAMPVPADSYFPNDYGLYGMSGNAAEFTVDGEVLGGSYKTAAEYCKIRGAKPYPFDASKPQSDVGFRLVCSNEGYTYSRTEEIEE